MQLTNRELAILKLISFEKTTSEIADHLFISFDTVKSYRKNLFKKMGVTNAAGLVRKGFETNILTNIN